jgi:hypothetical protein
MCVIKRTPHVEKQDATFRFTINLMCLFATSSTAASVRHWLNLCDVKFPAACRSTTLPVQPSTLVRYYI